MRVDASHRLPVTLFNHLFMLFLFYTGIRRLTVVILFCDDMNFSTLFTGVVVCLPAV